MKYIKTVSGWFRRLRRRSVAASILAASILAASAVTAQAETSQIDTSAATTAVNDIVDSIKTFFTSDMVKAATIIIGVAVVIWLIFLAWKIIKRAGNKAG